MPKLRTMYYRRATWLGAGPGHGDLQSLIDGIHRRLNTTAARTFGHKDGELQGVKIDGERRPRCTLLHIAYYVPRQPTSLVPDPAPVANSDTVERNPPVHHSYMNGDVFALLRGNDVILCNSGAREGAAKAYLAAVLVRGGVEDVFELEQVADVNKVEMVQREGVKSIRLATSVYKATQDRLTRETKKTNFMGEIAEEFLRLYADRQGMGPDELAEYENLQVKLEISFDSRRRGGVVAAEKLDAAANSLFAEDDAGFVITTKEGNTLTSEDIKVKKSAEIDDHGNSVACSRAWQAMLEYYRELRESGVVEE